jgi:hypothetical protein
MDKNLEILKRLIIEADEEETKVDSETTQVKEKPKNTAFEKDPMGFILKKYNTLNEIMIELMTKDFREFVDAIFYIAPKPTTFKIQLHNGQNFFLTYMKDNIYEAIIGGKRYYLAGIGEKERCMMAIARLLRFGTPLKTKGAEGAEEGTRDNTGMEGDWAANGGSGGGTETGSEEEVTASTEETGEELTENIKILTRLLMEIKKEEGTNLEDKILNLLSKDSTIAEYNPYKVQRDSGNNYKVYFKNEIGEKYPSFKGYYGVIEDTTPASNYNMMATYQVVVYDENDNEIRTIKTDFTNLTSKAIKEAVNLKQAKLSSAEYQKAKKLKDFKSSDWKWNADEDLYTKAVKEATDYMKRRKPEDDYATKKPKQPAYTGKTDYQKGREAEKKLAETIFSKLKEAKSTPCWKGYEQKGMKKKDGRQVPNCVPKN